MSHKYTTIQVPVEVHERLKNLAADEGRTLSRTVLHIIMPGLIAREIDIAEAKQKALENINTS